MQIATPKIQPCLWFDGEAEEAVRLYVSVFPGARLGRITRYGEAGKEIHGKAAGTVLTVEFELAGLAFMALNGGPQFKFTEAVSFQILCDSQAEIDHFWSRLGEGGEEGHCGWLKDRFGLSWQVVPAALPQMLQDPERAGRVTQAFLQMKKFDLAALERAYAGGEG